jgi:predicted nucleotidyltransferase
MQVTSYTDINALLDSLLMHMQNILRQKLVGLYLYGSLVSGDFDYESSDIDVLAVSYRYFGVRFTPTPMRHLNQVRSRVG